MLKLKEFNPKTGRAVVQFWTGSAWDGTEFVAFNCKDEAHARQRLIPGHMAQEEPVRVRVRVKAEAEPMRVRTRIKPN